MKKLNTLLISLGVFLLLVILCLFALNGRYKSVEPYGRFDSWTGKFHYIEPVKGF